MSSRRHAARGSRRGALAGVILSGALAAGALAVWGAWTRPDVVRLVDSSPARPMNSDGVGRVVPRPHRPPTLGAPTGSTSAPASSVREAGAPTEIAIVDEGISAQVLPEGLEPSGGLTIPVPAKVGWYDHGPGPGQGGTTLIAGHIDDFGVPGAFLHLNAVPTGARVTLDTSSGRTFTYVVTRRLEIAQGELARSGLLSDSGPPRLVLITCGGAYDTTTHLYLDNIVLVATPAGS